MTMRWDWGVMAAAAVGCMLFAARAQESLQVPTDAPAQTAAAADPPSQVARIGVLLGNVSVEPASVDQFSAAEVNYPLTTGDRIYADIGANAELQTGSLAVRLGQSADLTVTAMTDTLAQFGLAEGSVHLRSETLDQGSTVELDTPNVAITVLQPGDVRVDVDPAADATTVLVVAGQVQVDGNGLQQTLQAAQRVRLSGSDAVAAQWLFAGAPDGLDRFSTDRDAAYDSAVASEQQDVSAGTIGAEDLAGAGDWQMDAVDDGGPIWYPAGLAVGWQPYSCGHWTWIAPWGWTWVGCERWGFAPYHYGRWQRIGERWGWRPGPPVRRPIYAPALVVFVGSPGLAINGVGVTAWFPLGPHEPYMPWYHSSPAYLNRVNVTNIYDRNANRVSMELNQRSPSPAFQAGGDRTYANRQLATIAVAQESFAAGKPVAQPGARMNTADLASEPVLAHPLVTPQRAMVVSAPARAVPKVLARPELATRVDTAVHAPATVARSAPSNAQVLEDQAPAGRIPAGQSGTRRVEPGVAPAQPASSAHATHTAPMQVVEDAQPAAQAAATEARPAPRQLFNKAVPPEPRPNFEEQQKAIQSIDPGRPLSPQQMQSLRQNQPVQPAQQRAAPHPAPVARPAPAAAHPAPAAAPPAAPHKP